MSPKIGLVFQFFVLAVASSAIGQTSTLVSQNPDGSLTYGTYANQGEAEKVNQMIDFSFAGYEGGGRAIPWVSAKVILEPDEDGLDDYARIQGAIDQLSLLPPSALGFRGALVLRAGHYRVSGTLRIEADGVVIRGEGQGEDGTVITFTSTETGSDWTNGRVSLFEFFGSSGWNTVPNTQRTITDPMVPSGSRQLTLDSVDGLVPGDRILIQRRPNQAWIDQLGMGVAGINWTPEQYRSDLPRRIMSIDGNTITVDIPITHAIESRFGGGTISKYEFDGALRQVGIENLRLESSHQSATDENHGWIAVEFARVENAWARRVTARHFAYSCVAVDDHSQHITVEDCAMLDPVSSIAGGRRYSFVADDSSFILFQRCFTRSGRHDFVVQSKTAGPNVFVDCVAVNPLSDTGPHHRYSEGTLFDNISAGKLAVENRKNSGTGHGWAGSQTVFWNSAGTQIIVDAPTGAMNFSIGCIGNKTEGSWAPEEPFGFWESEGLAVTPRSLYYAQLQDRLGEPALRVSTSTAQRSGGIHSTIEDWAGDSAPPDLPALAPLGADAGPDQSTTESSVDLTAILRFPLGGSSGPLNSSWALLSGPSNVVIENPEQLQATVHFSTPGVYEFEFKVTQQDLSDPQNPVTHSNRDSLVVRFAASSSASVLPFRFDSIVGRTMGNGTSRGYYPSYDSDLVGVTGSFSEQTRSDFNLVIGFPLPDLPVGELLGAADLRFEISAVRNHSGQQPALLVDLLDVVDPTSSGTSWFFHGDPDLNPQTARVGRVDLPVAQGSEVAFTPGDQTKILTLSGESLTLLRSFYGQNPDPDRPYAFFRFSLSELPTASGGSELEGSILDRYRIRLTDGDNALELFANRPAFSFDEWIGRERYAVPLAQRLCQDDPDHDGLINCIEAWLGGHPMEAQPSPIENLMLIDDQISFSHAINPVIVRDLRGRYQWSENLIDWYDGDGVDGPGPGRVVDITSRRTGSKAEVTAIPSPSIDTIFLRLQVESSGSGQEEN